MPTHIPIDLPWLVWLLLFLLIAPPAAVSKAAARIPGLGGLAARWWQERRLRVADSERADRNAALLHALRTDYDAMQAELDAMAGQLAGLRSTVSNLDTALSKANRRLWSAIAYIRILADALRQHADTIPDAPDELQDIL